MNSLQSRFQIHSLSPAPRCYTTSIQSRWLQIGDSSMRYSMCNSSGQMPVPSPHSKAQIPSHYARPQTAAKDVLTVRRQVCAVGDIADKQLWAGDQFNNTRPQPRWASSCCCGSVSRVMRIPCEHFVHLLRMRLAHDRRRKACCANNFFTPLPIRFQFRFWGSSSPSPANLL